MRQVRFVGLSENGGSVVLELGDELLSLPIDERLRAAARGDVTRLGQIEIERENPLRPRDIQARVRAGESPEQLAAASKMPLDRILRFAYPVLQEREQITAEARRSRMRRSDGGQPRTLGELVDERLRARGVEPDQVAWDSWRREDGGWTVMARWRGTGGMATWAFELSARSATPADETAAELVADNPPRVRTVTPVTPLAVAARATPDGAVEDVPRDAERASAYESTLGGGGRARRSPAVPPYAGRTETRRPAARASEEPADEDRARRARVPSWDDILLGVRRRP